MMTNRSQIVITKVQDKTILVSVHNDKLYDVLVENEENTSGNVGDIFVGKVRMSWITFMRLLWNLRKIRLDSFL